MLNYTCQHHPTPATNLRSSYLFFLVKINYLVLLFIQPIPGLWWVPYTYIIKVLQTYVYQTVKISMGSHLSTLIILLCISAYIGILFPHSPIQKPLTPLCILVGVSLIYVQCTPLWTLILRGLSPVPFENLLPPDIAAFLLVHKCSLCKPSVLPTLQT